MKKVAEDQGFVIKDVPMDGDCALHVVVRQLQQQGVCLYDVIELRRRVCHYLASHPELANSTTSGEDFRVYLKQQAIPGTLCDETMLHAVTFVVDRDILIFDDDGAVIKFVMSSETCRSTLITIGRVAGFHYVSLESRHTSSGKDPGKPEKIPTSASSGACAAHDDMLTADERHGVVARYSYSKLQSEADKRKLSVVDFPQACDSALHAVIRQLFLQNITLYDVTTLRKCAVDYLHLHKYMISRNISDVQSYLSAQSAAGTHCDDVMLSAVAEVITKEIHILSDDGRLNKLGKQPSYSRPVMIGVYAKAHYVSLEPLDSKQEYKAARYVDRERVHNNNKDASLSLAQPSQRENDTAMPMQYTSPSAVSAGIDKPLPAAGHTCAICMDVIKDPKTLACTHVFCAECINQSLAYQPKCPCCGKLFGVLKGDQPEGGTMQVRKDKWLDLEGYPKCGRIVIDYDIPDGRQKVDYKHCI